MEDNTAKQDLQQELAQTLKKASPEAIADFTRRLRQSEANASALSTLTEQQVEAARLVASANLTDEEVCLFVDCTVRQLRAWQATEAFQNKMGQFIKSGLINMAPMAPKVLRDILKNGDNKEKIAAAKLLMSVVDINAGSTGAGDLEEDLNIIESRGSIYDEADL